MRDPIQDPQAGDVLEFLGAVGPFVMEVVRRPRATCVRYRRNDIQSSTGDSIEEMQIDEWVSFCQAHDARPLPGDGPLAVFRWLSPSVHGDVFDDGEQLLVAVRVHNRTTQRERLEYSVIHAVVDEDGCELREGDDVWGWGWDCVECYMPMNQIAPAR